MRLSKMKQAVASLLMTAICVLTPMQVFAESSSNYCYSTATKEYYQAPAAYEVERVLYADDLGVESLKGISGMFVKGKRIYVTTANSLVVFNTNYAKVKQLTTYTNLDGVEETFSNPDGIFVTDNGDIYICEPDKGRVLHFNKSYELVNVYGQPKGLKLEVSYSPIEIVVDSLNRMYIVAKNVYEGILEVNADNEFQRYFGETTVNISALDLLWRQIATEEQKARQSLILPTEYSSITMTSAGFIYATASSNEEKEPIKLLNVKGSNILAYDDEFDLYPSGDVVYSVVSSDFTTTVGPSKIGYVDCNDYGMYIALDIVRNRIFTYNETGDMLCVFGGDADMDGCFNTPVSIRYLEDDILVADSNSQSITVMTPTVYGKTIIDATKLDAMGERDDAVELWNKVTEMNPHFEVAYEALGKAALRDKNYESAAVYFKKANSRVYYSKAYAQTRDAWLKANFTNIVVGAVVLIAVYNVAKVVIKKRKKGKVG